MVGPALADLTWPHADQRLRAGALLAVPIGSTEQHGPHLPLGTDTDIATALCHELARRRPDVLVAPAIPYGASGEHQQFPGTVSIGTAALAHLLVELVRSATTSVNRVLLVNAHGGNLEAITNAVRTLRAEARNVLAFSPRWPSELVQRGDVHAGQVETSVQLALAPERVHLPEAKPGPHIDPDQLLPRLRAEGVRPVSPTGVLGDPMGATPGAGEGFLASFVAQLLAAVAAWAGPPPPVDGSGR